MTSPFAQLLDPPPSEHELWQLVAQAAFDKRRALGADSLTGVQVAVLDAWAASGSIGNRGFFEHEPDEMRRWAEAYRRIGAPDTADAVERAAAAMLQIDFDAEDEQRERALLGPIEDQYYALDRHTEHLVARYIRTHAGAALDGLEPHLPKIIQWIMDTRARGGSHR